MPSTTAADTYHVRVEASPNVQQELLHEQGQRQMNGERVSLMKLAAKWLEEIAEQKRAQRG